MKTITIIGAGNVGAHVASNLIHRNLDAVVQLVDACDPFEEAQVLDLKDMSLHYPRIKVRGADLGEKRVEKSDIVVITAGAKQAPGEPRSALLGRNIKILKNILKDLGTLKPEAIVIVISNPVDILTQIASETLKLPRGHVMGSGTFLDTARLRWRLAEHFHQDLPTEEGYVMGEHGDSEFVAWSTVEEESTLTTAEKKGMEESVRKAAYKIIEGKGATYFGIGAAVGQIIESILSNKKVITPVSAPLHGEYGIEKMSIGVPVVLGKDGIEEIRELPLSTTEQKKLTESAKKLKAFRAEL